MAVQITPLFTSQVITNAWASYYTALAPTRIDAMALYNGPPNAIEFCQIAWVPSGGAIGNANIIQGTQVFPNQTWIPFGFVGQTLGTGDMIYALGTAGGLVNFFASGTVSS